MIRTQIQIHDDQIRWLKHHALGKGVSMAQLVRDCIDFYRAHMQNTKLLVEKKKNALAAVGNFSSTDK
jgi:hypothetical protein